MLVALDQKFDNMIGHLASVTSSSEHDFLYNTLGARGAWIALADYSSEGTFRITAGPEVGLLTPITRWNSGEPNNAGNNEHCAEIANSGWNDIGCSGNRFVVVEYECSYDPGVYRCFDRT